LLNPDVSFSMSGESGRVVASQVRGADDCGRQEYVPTTDRITHCHGNVWVICPCGVCQL